eukprot:jgi/Tetstr1/461192/TSEL_006329.t1
MSMSDAVEASGGLSQLQATALSGLWAAAAALSLSSVFVRENVLALGPSVAGLSLSAVHAGETALLGGLTVAALGVGLLQERLGRRGMAVISAAGLVLGAALSLSSTDTAYVAGRAVVGAATGGVFQSTHCLACEVSPAKQQSFLVSVLNAQWCIGCLGLVALAFCVPGWRDFGLILAVATGVLTAACAALLPESPRWLAHRGDISGATGVLAALAKQNGRPWARGRKLRLSEVGETASPAAAAAGDSGAPKASSPWTSQLLWNTAWMLFATTGLALLYWAMSIGVGGLEGCVYSNAVANYGAELPTAMVVGYFLNSRLGRRGTAVLSFTFTAVACGMVVLAPSHGGAAVAVGKLAICGAYAAVFTQVGEMYPTSLRGVGVMLARLGDGLGSYLASFALGVAAPHCGLAAIAALSACAAFMMPETKGAAIS